MSVWVGQLLRLQVRSSFPPDGPKNTFGLKDLRSSPQVPSLHRSASMHSSRPPSLGHLRPPEHSDCNGKGSPSTLGPTHLSLEDNTEDDNAEEEIALVCPVILVVENVRLKIQTFMTPRAKAGNLRRYAETPPLSLGGPLLRWRAPPLRTCRSASSFIICTKTNSGVGANG